MNPAWSKHARGQSLVIFALALFGMLALLALVLDGGLMYSHRRTAQTAADAAALAGATELCLTEDASEAYLAATSYATRNDATMTSFTYDLENRQVWVNTNITFDTFFAHLLNQPQIPVPAEASAGCANPGIGQGLLPVAWSCRWSIEGGGGGGDPACIDQTLTVEEVDYRLAHPLPGLNVYPELYILMDSEDLDEDILCQPDGPVLCDLDGDGEDDLLAGGDRSWMDLDGGGGGSSELSDWVLNGYTPEIEVHTWIGGQTGVTNSVFQAVDDRRRTNPIVAVPVFDQYCQDYPFTTPECQPFIHADDNIIESGGASTTYYHVIAFAAFYITCVDAPGVPGGHGCPGHNRAVSLGSIRNNDKTIEGYFLRGYIPGLSGDGGAETGVYNILLRR
jgi:hypothetical protein